LIPFHADTNQGCVILLEKETSFAVTPEHLQFKGRGWVWNSREQEARYGRIEGEATSDPPMDDQQINQLRQYISGWGQELGE
ncbi:MAG: hypothetical protein KDI50_05175, partial [Candidatus Competibacteraceae bacterium]|nr:hypothetical protein [Candidatus Competibacteraceae bacterium]